MEEEIDRQFMIAVEGYSEKGYVPSNNSGVTIGVGLDLSAQSL